jgi:hypothetical protein
MVLWHVQGTINKSKALVTTPHRQCYDDVKLPITNNTFFIVQEQQHSQKEDFFVIMV